MADELNSSDSDISEDEVFDFESEIMAKYDMRSLSYTYSGNPDDDLDLFFERFESHAKLRDFASDKIVLALMTKIDGHAKIFLDSVADSDKNSVKKVYDLLKENFEGQAWHWNVESKLLSRKQIASESLDSYASDILHWCRQINKPDTEQMSIFVRGLLPSLRAFVFSKQPKTFREALDAARLGLSVQQTANCDLITSSTELTKTTPKESVNDINDSTLNSLNGVISSIEARVNKLEHDKSNNASFTSPNYRQRQYQSNYRPARNIECHRCGRIGHKWRKCHAKFGVDGMPLN